MQKVYLFKKLKEGNFSVFDEFYEQTKRGVYYIIRKYTDDKTIIEDMMQDTYLSFIDNIKNIDDDKNFTAYLLMIAKNKTLNYLKKHGREDIEEDMDAYAGDYNLDTPLLNYSKNHLSGEEWKLIEMCIINGYRRVEVADILNMPVSTVNWQYNQVIKKIKKFYKEVY